MNKSNLVDSIIKNTDLTKTKAGLVVDAVMSAIIGALKSGHSVTLIGFGSFSAVKRAARMGRNPKTGKEIKIPSKTVAKFKAGKALKEAVSGIKSKTKTKPEPKMKSKLKAKPVSKVKAKPVSKVKAKPVSKVKAKPVSKVKAKPVSKVKAKPVMAKKAVKKIVKKR